MNIILPDEGLTLTNDEQQEFKRRKACFPFRDWHAVKVKSQDAEYFDTKRKAMNYAKKHAPAAIFRI